MSIEGPFEVLLHYPEVCAIDVETTYPTDEDTGAVTKDKNEALVMIVSFAMNASSETP
jgi:hypothetical protein